MDVLGTDLQHGTEYCNLVLTWHAAPGVRPLVGSLHLACRIR